MAPRIGVQNRQQLANLESKLGNRTLRQILTPEGNRLMRPERLSNLLSGRGRLTEDQKERIELAARNSRQLSNLQTRGEGKSPTRSNRALRDWLLSGKAKGTDYYKQSEDERKKQLKAIRALRFFEVDPTEGTFYVRKDS